MFLTADQYVAEFGEEEALQIAGLGPRDYRELDRAKIEEAIDWASSVILGFVRERYPSAADFVTPLLRGWCADIARWRLRGRGGQQSAMNEMVQKRYDEAMRALRDVADGRLSLDTRNDGNEQQPEPPESVSRVLAEMPASRTKRALEGFL